MRYLGLTLICALIAVSSGCRSTEHVLDAVTFASPSVNNVGPLPAPGMISYRDAAETAWHKVKGSCDFDLGAEITVVLEGNAYIVTFPPPAGSDNPGAYSCRVRVDAFSGKVISVLPGY